MPDGPSLTRRQALRAGAGALALGAVRLPSPAQAATRPRLFTMRIDDGGAHAAGLWRTTRVLPAPHRFDLVGLRWSAGAVEAQIRTRRAGGRWTRWTPLPAPHGPLRGTDPAFMGHSDELQLRLRGSARGLRACFVRSLGSAPAHAHAAQLDPPGIIPRSGWGGDGVIPRAAPEFGVVQIAFVHHTVTAIDYAPSESASIVLGIAHYHRDYNGWNDIGYNFLVDRYGQVFEGRAGGIENAVVGAQAQGWNSQSTGIACLGTFTNVRLPGDALDALARLIGWKLSLHGVPVLGRVTLESGGGADNRYRLGTDVVFQRVSGHRDGDATSCPGNALYRQLGDLRDRADGYAAPLNGITVATSAYQHGVRPVALAGVLRFADGSSPAGATLSIEFTAAGSAWSPVAAALCGADGSWQARAVLPSSGDVRAVFAGDGLRPRVESPPIPVKVVPRISVASSRRTGVGGRIAVSGAVSPAPAKVHVTLQRRVGRHWVRVGRRRSVAVVGGRYATSVRLTRRGLYRVSVSAGGATKRRNLRAI
jgi:N-acetylmuramoyl-L-alanine amidase-like protein